MSGCGDSEKKEDPELVLRSGSLCLVPIVGYGMSYFLLLTATVAAHELVYTTSRIDELSLTREEGV